MNWCLAVIRLGTDGPRWLKCREMRKLRRSWRISGRTGGYVEFSGTVQAFQTGQKGSAVDCCWLPVVVVHRLACEGVVIFLRCSVLVLGMRCGPGDREPTSLIDKSNVGRFDCAPSTCMHFPRLPGVVGKAGWQEGQKGQAGSCIRLPVPDVTSSSSRTLSSELTRKVRDAAMPVAKAVSAGFHSRIKSLPLGLALRSPCIALHCITSGSDGGRSWTYRLRATDSMCAVSRWGLG